MKILDYLKNHIVYMDGGMGTLLQKQGLKPGELPERWNISHPDIITDIHNPLGKGCQNHCDCKHNRNDNHYSGLLTNHLT